MSGWLQLVLGLVAVTGLTTFIACALRGKPDFPEATLLNRSFDTLKVLRDAAIAFFVMSMVTWLAMRALNIENSVVPLSILLTGVAASWWAGCCRVPSSPKSIDIDAEVAAFAAMIDGSDWMREFE